MKDIDTEIKKVAYKGEFKSHQMNKGESVNKTGDINIKEKLSPEFDDLIKTLQFPDKFYDILDRVIKREIEENKEKIMGLVERVITRRYLTERKLGKGTGEFWEDLKQEIKNEVKI